MIRPRIRTCRRRAVGRVLAVLGLASAFGVPGGPCGARAATALDSLVAARADGRWSAVDSIATRLLPSLPLRTRADSLAVLASLEATADARWRLRGIRDARAATPAIQGAVLADRLAPGGRSRALLRVLAASVLVEANQSDSAAAVLATVPASPPLDDSLAAEVHYWRGRLLEGRQGVAAAMPEYALALGQHERHLGGEHPRVAEVLTTIGGGLIVVGDYDSASTVLDRARLIVDRDTSRLDRTRVAVYAELSTLWRNLGSLSLALDYAKRALEIAHRWQGDSTLTVGRMHAQIALRHLLLGQSGQALRHFDAAIPLLARHLGPTAFPTVNNALYRAHARVALGDTAWALAELDSLEAVMAPDSAAHAWNRTFLFNLRALIEQARGEPARARALAERAYRMAEGARDPRGTARAEVVSILFECAAGASDRAWLDSLGRAFDSLSAATGLRRNAVHRSATELRARAEVRTGADEAGWAHALEAERLGRERLQADVRALPESEALGLAGRFGGALDPLVWLAAEDPANRAATAWDRLVRWRGLVRDEVARLRPPRAGATEAIAAQQAWTAARRRLARMLVAGVADRDDAAGREAFEAARAAADEAERRYVRESGLAAARSPDSISLARVRATPRRDEAIVSFAVATLGAGFERLVAFVAAGDSAAVRVLDLGPPAAAREAIADWRAWLGTSPRSGAGGPAAERACRHAGERVRRLVWDPVASALGGATRVDVVGEDALLDLPWHALPLARGGYLVEGNVAVRTLEAERDRLLPAPPAEGPGSLLAVGDPDFRDRPAANRAAPPPFVLRGAPEACIGDLSRLDRLPAAAEEAEAIAGAWRAVGGDARLLLGGEASESAFKAAAPGRTVLHLATHGAVLTDTCLASAPGTRGVGGVSPLAAAPRAGGSRRPATTAAATARTSNADAPVSGRVILALAGASQPPSGSTDENEGWLTAEEVATLDLRGVDWVVLSACHSGAGERWPREGVLGMSRAFRLAGARAVIASRWAVEDRATAEWMRALYAARAAGARDAAEALRRATRDVLARRRAEGRSTHPFYWAAFGATGG